MTPVRRVPPLLLVLTLAFVGARLDAQVIRGQVTDGETGTPIEAVTLRLINIDGEIVAGAASDAEGVFEFRPREGGFYSVDAERIGYQRYRSDPVSVPEQESVEVRIRLGVDAVPLAPFVVLADSQLGRGRLAEFENRRRDPTVSGYFLGEEEIAARPLAKPSQYLEVVPSVDLYRVMTEDNRFGLDRNLIFLPGSRGFSLRDGMCLAQVFVNGVIVRQSQDGSTTVDDYLDGAPIAGIEVYTRAAAAPFEYRGTGECGVVLYWTEEPQASSSSGWGVKRIALGVGILAGILLVGFSR